ncbi:hypothetical protein, partial [Psychrobacter sp. TB55-MNA-CIBAN-0194]|uniref:hypothetical protein n=1 Tax=Psychrobacter sp. TB55-MNA-CIBAN-0194 TaxID=3140445 RepID=UPI003317D2AE
SIIKNSMTAAEKTSMDDNLLINEIWATLYTQRSNISDADSQFIDDFRAIAANNCKQFHMINNQPTVTNTMIL